jgi:hypothetical protein
MRVVCGSHNDEADRKFLLKSAKQWKKLAAEKEQLEIRASARAAA